MGIARKNGHYDDSKTKLLVDSQNSFLVYHFKSLNLVQNSAMNETFFTIAGHLIRTKEVSINMKNHNHYCRSTHGIVRKRNRTLTVTRHQEDN